MGGTDIVDGATAGSVKPGDVLAGKYRVERVLGEGGMGVVVAAHHIQLDERVALKFLLPQALKNAEAVGRFTREARAAVKIKSEHVARVTDVGELETGAPYIVMEYLEGVDLAAFLAERGPLPIDRAVGLLLEACEALAEAHALGIVHRDVKPANLFLANRPSGPPIIKVLDFGISKSSLSSSQPQLTKTSSIMGSPLYMSPEQMQSSKSVDLRSDIWALGVVLYELVGGRVPFQGDTMPELILAVLQRTHEPLGSLRPDVPPGFEAVLDRCLSKTPAARFSNVAELATALGPYGPPSSRVSVERIAHVLAAVKGDGDPPSRHKIQTDAYASPVASTLPGDDSVPRLAAPSGTTRRSAPSVGAATTTKAVSTSSPPAAPPRLRGSLYLPVAGVVVALAVGGFVVLQGRGPAASAAAATASPPPAVATIAPPVPTTTAEVVVTTTDAGAATTTAAAPPQKLEKAEKAAPLEPSRSAAPRPVAAPPARGKPPAAVGAAPPKPNCNPPYIIDAEGHHQYKPECN